MEFLLTEPLQFVALFIALGAFAFWCAKKPQDAAVLIVMLTPLYLVRVREELALNFIAGVVGVNALDLLLAVFVVVVAVRFFTRHDDATQTHSIPWWAGPAVLMILGAALATLFAESQLQLRALGELKSIFVLPVLFAFAVSWLCTQHSELRQKLLFAIVLSAAWQAAAAFLGAFFFDEFITYDMRLRGFFLSPNHLAMLLSPALVLGTGLWFNETSKNIRRVLFVIVIVIVAALAATQSLGGIASAVFGVLLLALFLSRNRLSHSAFGSHRPIAVMVIVIVIVAALAPLAFQQESFTSRLMVWQAAGEILKTHWLLGIGPGAFQHHYLLVQEKFPPYLEWAVPQPHNLFLAVWLSAGLVGLIGFLWLLIGIAKRALSALRRTPSTNYYLLSTTIAALAAIVAHGLIDTPVLKNDLALVFWVLLAL